MESSSDTTRSHPSFFAPLIAGAVAGLSVDMTLYPLDTLKTRLQSQQGFLKAGGFRGVYRGLATVAATSMPTSALFFASYETTKNLLLPHVSAQYAPFVHMFGASIGEVFACIIRVPTEIAKQRKQTYVGTRNKSALSILFQAYRLEGLSLGVYRGFLSTVARDLPFSFIQMPVWELLKGWLRQGDGQITSLQSAACGAMAGALSAAATTPLDLAKTRIMLAPTSHRTHTHAHTTYRIRPILANIYREAGLKGLFAGVTPRTIAFMTGGFVFFGVYDDARSFLEKNGV